MAMTTAVAATNPRVASSPRRAPNARNDQTANALGHDANDCSASSLAALVGAASRLRYSEPRRMGQANQ